MKANTYKVLQEAYGQVEGAYASNSSTASETQPQETAADILFKAVETLKQEIRGKTINTANPDAFFNVYALVDQYVQQNPKVTPEQVLQHLSGMFSYPSLASFFVKNYAKYAAR